MHIAMRAIENSFVAREESLNVTPTIVRLFVFTFLVFTATWFLQPDLFGLLPNGLDPMFYTGYSLNLDDAIAAAGNTQYCVTRWTAYLPTHLLSTIVGPNWGRLILRIFMLLSLAELMWRFFHKYNISVHARMLSIFMLVSSPMFVRAFTTDYPEYFIVWGSLILLILSFQNTSSPLRMCLMGVLAASVVIANPNGLVLALVLMTNQFVVLSQNHKCYEVGKSALIALSGFFGTFLFGYLIFKYHYHVENIYQPTFRTLQNYAKPEIDGWRAPTRRWLLFFGWLYLPPIFVFAALLLGRTKNQGRQLFRRLSVLVAVIFLYHVILEFQNGHGLETSFYWSMLLSPVLLTFCCIIAFKVNNSSRIVSTLIFLTVLVSLRFEIPEMISLRSGVYLLLFVFLLVGALAYFISKNPVAFLTILVLGSIWLQTGSPDYRILTNGGNLNSPRYDLVYGDSETGSQKVLEEVIWFLERMDDVPMDSTSFFMPTGGWSSPITGTYIAQPFGRVLSPQSPTQVLSEEMNKVFNYGYRPLLVIYGDEDKSTVLLQRVQRELPLSKVYSNIVNPNGLRYRLIVVLVYGRFSVN